MKRLMIIVGMPCIFLAFMLTTGAYATKHTVTVQNFVFTPSSLPNVFVGDTIRWIWVNGSHTTTSTTIPAGAATWNSPISFSAQVYEYKVTIPGTYNYRCTPHFSSGMIGSFTAANPPSLAVTPSNQNVTSAAGSTSFAVTTSVNWTAVSNQPWCTVTASGSGNGTLVANYSDNTFPLTRIAGITVNVAGGTPVIVTVTQAQSVNKTLNLTLYLEGLFNGATMNHAQGSSGNQFPGNTADQVFIELHNATPPYDITGTPFLANLSIEGTASLSIPGSFSDNYYIVVKHRNSIETWNSSPVSFSGQLITYDFSTAASQAYGGNLRLIAGKYVIYGGDVTQDDLVDSADITPVDNDSGNFETGYLVTDANGDGSVDTADMTILDNNSSEYIATVTP
jgi:plastocyanin